MAEIELHGNSDGYVLCPVRGEVPVEWCAGCAHVSQVDRSRSRAVVVCSADPRPVRPWPDLLGGS